MGVAVEVSTSTSLRICLRRSLWATPKRCSSSMITSPRSLNRTSLCMSRCVPMQMSIRPLARPSTTWRCSKSVRNLLRTSIVVG